MVPGVAFKPHVIDGKTVLRSDAGQVYVPDGRDLRLKVLILAHSGVMGHRGVEHTVRVVKTHFLWEDVEKDVKTFIKACALCLPTSSGKVPVPLASTLHTSVTNRLLHADFMFMAALRERSSHGYRYVLVVKDDASGYVWLRATETCDSRAVVETLVDWCAVFGVFEMFNSDGGSHFTSKVVSELTERLGINHHIVTPYAPFANGTIERENSTVLNCLRAMLVELNADESEWPYLLPVVQLACNTLRRERLGWNTPLRVFTGRESRSALAAMFPADPERYVSVDLDKVMVQTQVQEIAAEMDQLQESLARRQSRRYRSDVLPTFSVGDYVLVARAPTQIASKLQWRWRGPYRVEKIVDTHSYVVKLVIGPEGKRREERVHARRMLRVSGVDSPPGPETLQLASRLSDGCEVEKFLDHRIREEEHQLCVRWKPNGDQVDVTWEPLLRLYQDVPEMVKKFVQRSRSLSRRERAEAAELLGITL